MQILHTVHGYRLRRLAAALSKVCWSSLKMPSPLQSTKSTNALTHPAQLWHTLHYWMSSIHAAAKGYNWSNVTCVHNASSVYDELAMNEQVPVKKLHIDEWKDLCEQLANQEWRHLQCNQPWIKCVPIKKLSTFVVLSFWRIHNLISEHWENLWGFWWCSANVPWKLVVPNLFLENMILWDWQQMYVVPGDDLNLAL